MSPSQNVALALGFALCAALVGCKGKGEKSNEQPSKQGATKNVKRPVDSKIPLEAVAKRPRPGTSMPGAFAFSPDGKVITFLDSADKSLTRQLYQFDLATKKRRTVFDAGKGDTEENLSAEEKLRRERQRIMTVGVTRYYWSKSGGKLMIPLGGDIHVMDGLAGKLRKVVDTQGKPALAPSFSRDGKHVAYVQDNEVYVANVENVAGGKPVQVSKGARGTGKTHGRAEYIAQEEMGRYSGFWWARDGAMVAFTQVDETHIPAYRIVHQGKQAVGTKAQEDHGYPFAGKANAKIKLGVVSAKGGATRWMDLGANEDIYLARVNWMPDGSLWAQVQNRAQSELNLICFDPKTGKGTRVLQETSKVWINLHDDLRALPKASGDSAGGFLWSSERDGFKHLYVYDKAGKLLRQLTKGEWMVDRVVSINQKAGTVYFTAAKDGVTESNLYSVPLAGGDITRITKEPGFHRVTIDKQFVHFIDTWSSKDHSPKVVVRKLADGAAVATLHDAVDPKVAEYGLLPPELVTLKSRDGTVLHGAIYKPPAQFKAPYPTLISVYGGPHAQMVKNSWRMTVDMRTQYLRSLGYLVFKLDNRGSARRGLKFEGALKHDMGNVELRDQVDGVNWLVNKGLADKTRVGMYGWSYGGYMAAMALARAPETFKVAVAGAPVTHWDGYDTHYTERYMGTPQSNVVGYRESSVMHHVKNLKGKLLLVHGLIDENVHFRHTARLINALIKARKDYTLLLFPDERHSPRSQQDRVYMEQRIRDYFFDNL